MADRVAFTFQPRAGKPRMNFRKQFFAHRRLRKRQQRHFIHRRSRALRAGIKFADRLNFVAKQLNAQWPVSFRRIGIQQPAANGVLAGHLHHVNGGIADGVQVLDQLFQIQHVSPMDDACQTRIVLCRVQPH